MSNEFVRILPADVNGARLLPGNTYDVRAPFSKVPNKDGEDPRCPACKQPILTIQDKTGFLWWDCRICDKRFPHSWDIGLVRGVGPTVRLLYGFAPG